MREVLKTFLKISLLVEEERVWREVFGATFQVSALMSFPQRNVP